MINQKRKIKKITGIGSGKNLIMSIIGMIFALSLSLSLSLSLKKYIFII
jgi:hypothetical protein